ncbi:hypothetical protein GCM10020000_16120 [Streptomyces olivoverticillatus]
MPIEAHTSRPWLIHEIAPDFRIEDVWSFRTPGAGPDDFPVMLAALEASNRPGKTTWPTRFLFAVRWKLGAVFGWDKPQAGPGRRRDVPAGSPSGGPAPLPWTQGSEHPVHAGVPDP